MFGDKRFKAIYGIFTILILICLISTNVRGATETIYIAGDNAFPPYEFLDDNGKYKGFDIDIINAVALESGLEVVFVPTTWKGALYALDSGRVQAIAGMTYSGDRSKKYLFSNKTVINSQVIFVRKETTSIIEKDNLKGKRVAVEDGDVSEEYIKNIPGIKIIKKTNQKEAVEALINKECDAFVGNENTTNYILETMGKSDNVKIVGEPVHKSDYGIVVLKGNSKLIRKFNQGINIIKQNKTYDKIYNKWFGKPLVSKSENIKKILIFVLVGGCVLLAIIILISVINRKLVSAVKKKTSQLQLANEKLVHIAYYDVLTGFPNKAFFTDKLKDLLEEAKKENKIIGVMLIDIDNFKNINDILGHEFGDKVLLAISQELNKYIKDNDVICRFGGDEFIIIKSNMETKNDLEQFAKDVLDNFRKSIFVNDQQIYTTLSMGISYFPENGCDENSLLKQADTALHSAKENGKNSYEFFNTSFYNEVLKKTEIESGLRRAIEKNEFVLYFQPQVDVSTGKVNSMEALIRWNNPFSGFVSPGEFIPLAEETGLIVPIGEWVLRNACVQSVLWRKKGIKDICICINISEVQLRQNDFISKVNSILKETGLDPKFIEFEITESAMMKSMEHNIKILQKLKKMGIKIALDDFGTGYSSLNYLRSLPIDNLKIDKSFINNICFDANDEAIIDGIIFLAHKIKLQVIVEGVETLEQLNLLSAKGCDKIQGFYFSKPCDAKEMEKYIYNKNNIVV